VRDALRLDDKWLRFNGEWLRFTLDVSGFVHHAPRFGDVACFSVEVWLRFALNVSGFVHDALRLDGR
jgi:hypothetical protein